MAYRIVKEITNYNNITYTVEANTWFGLISRLLNWQRPIIDMALYECPACYKTLEEAIDFVEAETLTEFDYILEMPKEKSYVFINEDGINLFIYEDETFELKWTIPKTTFTVSTSRLSLSNFRRTLSRFGRTIWRIDVIWED